LGKPSHGIGLGLAGFFLDLYLLLAKMVSKCMGRKFSEARGGIGKFLHKKEKRGKNKDISIKSNLAQAVFALECVCP
jgi:hypothetical protein